MGWCSATPIFDRVADRVLRSDASVSHQASILRILADTLADHDWDCQWDSKYADHEWVAEILGTEPEAE